MSDTTVIKVDSSNSPESKSGAVHLASGKSMAMRLWEEDSTQGKPEGVSRDYETVGFVIDGSAELVIEGQTVKLNAGDSWVVPKGARHTYRILKYFKAVEATHPPYQLHGRSE